MPIFKARSHVGETGVSVTFLRPVSGSVSRRIKKPHSGKILGVFPGRFSGRVIIVVLKGVGTKIENARQIFNEMC